MNNKIEKQMVIADTTAIVRIGIIILSTLVITIAQKNYFQTLYFLTCLTAFGVGWIPTIVKKLIKTKRKNNK